MSYGYGNMELKPRTTGLALLLGVGESDRIIPSERKRSRTTIEFYLC